MNMLHELVWHDGLATGLAEIDDQHRHLIGLVGELAVLQAAPPDAERVQALYHQLRDYTRYHFDTEAALMAAWPVDPANRARHLRAHAGFVQYLDRVGELITQPQRDVLANLLAFLARWLLHHIGSVDARLAREIQELRGDSREPGAVAPAGTRVDTPDAAPPEKGLADVVSDLYDDIALRSLELLELNRRLQDEIAEKTRVQTHLRQSEAHYRAVIDNGQILIWTSGPDRKLEFFNRPWLAFTGRSAGEERGWGWVKGVHPQDIGPCRRIYFAAFERQEPFQLAWRLRRHDGEYRWMSVEGTPRYDERGEFSGYVGHCLDITDLKLAQGRQRLAALIFETMGEAVMVTDPQTVIQRVNASFTQITGYTESEVAGRSPRFLTADRHDEAYHTEMWETLQYSGRWVGELWYRCRDGAIRPLWHSVTALRDEHGKVSHYVAVLNDLTEIRRAQEAAERLMWRDPLTGLANRAQFLRQLDHALATAHREDRYADVLLIDLDRFKTVNEARGLGFGDTLLRMVGEVLTHRLHADDVVAHLGSDEFAVMLRRPRSARDLAGQHALAVAERIRATLNAGMTVGGEALQLEISTGIALFPLSHNITAPDMLRQADVAMRQAKAQGGNRSVFFELAMGEAIRRRSQTEQALRAAIAQDQLRVYLQPQVDRSGRPVGAEALVRWAHPERGLLAPIEFVPLAEESDLVVALDRWVLAEVCRLLARSDRTPATTDAGPMTLAVNISARHFRRSDFVDGVRQCLAESGANPARLVLEVTESLVIDDIDAVIARMGELKALGVRFSLDDFGTGYSSLAYLKRLPIHEVKIDKSFIRDLTTDDNDAALVDAILAVASRIGLQVVAEGVETREQADFLNARGELIHQGYLFGRPQPAEDWLAMPDGG